MAHSHHAIAVLCPGHLLRQWQSELEQFSAHPLAIVSLPTIVQMRNTSFQQLADAGMPSFVRTESRPFSCGTDHLPDVVLVPHSLLLSEHYQNIPSNLKPSALLEQAKARADRLKAKGSAGQPHLEQVHWHRVVLDEAGDAIVTAPIPRKIFLKLLLGVKL